MNKCRAGPYFNRSLSNGSNDLNLSMFVHPNQSVASEGPSFSSLFKSNAQSSREGNNHVPKHPIEPMMPMECSSGEDGGVFLQISNLDAWYDEANLKNYLTSQLKPITPILSLNIETPSIAKIKVPSVQVMNAKLQSPFWIPTKPFPVLSCHSSRSKSFRTCIGRKWGTSASSCLS